MTTRALILSAYDASSHARWRRGLLDATATHIEWHSEHLPPRHFDWRMRGHALYWGTHTPASLQRNHDILLTTSTVDLVAVRGMLPHLAQAHQVIYFHENQFAYPERPDRPNPNLIHHRLTSIYNAVAADRLIFNSQYNRTTFLNGAKALLQSLPDHTPDWTTLALEQKSIVLPVPLEEQLSRQHRHTPSSRTSPIRILWNHRWEYDKAPERFFRALFQLKDAGHPFDLIVVGQRFRRDPPIFNDAKHTLASNIVHWGFVEDRATYEALVASADVAVSTALHDFQGLALQEAMALGVRPLTPDRLAYPEYVPDTCRYTSTPQDAEAEQHALAQALEHLIQTKAMWRHERATFPQHWTWAARTTDYLAALSNNSSPPTSNTRDTP